MPDHLAATATGLLDPEERGVVQPAIAGSGATRHRVIGWCSLVTRLLGAGAVLVVGVVHLQAYGGPYSAVSTIGTLFLLNFAAATAIGVTLLLPLERLARRWATLAVVLTTAAGLGLAAVSLVMLIVAEHGVLFGFHEPGYDPEAISRSRIAEIAAVGLLTASLALRSLATWRPRW